LAGLPDLDQAASRVDDYLLRAHKFWLDRFPALAGYRMDTIKHVSTDWWESFDRRLTNRYPEAEFIGEYFPGGSTYPASWPFYRQTSMTMFDFSLRDALRDIFVYDASFARLLGVWERDPALGDATALVTFLDNHDMPRLRSEGLSLQRLPQALVLWLTSRGIPSIYYGVEQDLFHPGQGEDPFNRPMMDSFDEDFSGFRLIQILNRLRLKTPALRFGETHVVHLTEHIIGYERLFEGQGVFVAMSKNPREGSDDFPMTGLRMPDGTYRDLLSGRQYRIRGGRLDVSLRNGDIVLLSTTRGL
jgi:cyclomaltodextrin glucanotransferase